MRRVPKRSASMPAKGWAMPHTMFCSARPTPNTSRPQSFDCDCGLRNKPRTERGPKLSSDIRQPQSTIMAGVRQLIERSEVNEKETAIGEFLSHYGGGNAFRGLLACAQTKSGGTLPQRCMAAP